MLSIIIPTFNEEKYLPKLLDSIKNQDFSDYEIIVADNDSKDKTREIAKKHNCKIVPGGLPAEGKNNGVKISKGDLLFFIDADVFLPENSLNKILNEFKKRKLKSASFMLIPYGNGNSWFVRFLFNMFYNFPIILMERILAHGAMGILIEKNLFKKIKSFNKNIKLAEDHDLARRASKKGKFGIIKSSKIFVSDRRFRKDGWLRTFIKFLLCEFHMIFIGSVEKDIFNYKFGHYSQNKKDKI